MKYTVIAISRTLGAGGEDLGEALARELGFRYVDAAILQKASEAAGVRSAPSFTSILSPNNSIEGSLAPTVAIASDTSISFRAVFAPKATRAESGCTCIPSRISPAHVFRFANATPTGPGFRPSRAGIALNRCVNPTAPAAISASMSSADPAVCPMHTRTPASDSVFTSAGDACSGDTVAITGKWSDGYLRS